MDNVCEDYKAKLSAAREELKHAGPIHRRDLLKHIRRMEKKIRYNSKTYKERKIRGDINATGSPP